MSSHHLQWHNNANPQHPENLRNLQIIFKNLFQVYDDDGDDFVGIVAPPLATRMPSVGILSCQIINKKINFKCTMMVTTPGCCLAPRRRCFQCNWWHLSTSGVVSISGLLIKKLSLKCTTMATTCWHHCIIDEVLQWCQPMVLWKHPINAMQRRCQPESSASPDY